MFRKKVLDKGREEKAVDVAGESVVIREMSARDRLAAFQMARNGEETDHALLCFAVLVKSAYQDGQRVFSDDDAKLLADAPFDADVDKLATEAIRINKLLPTDTEDLEKN